MKWRQARTTIDGKRKFNQQYVHTEAHAIGTESSRFRSNDR